MIPPDEVSTERAREAIPAEVPLGRRRRQRLRRRAAGARPAAAPTSTWSRAGSRDQHPPGAAPRPLPALDGDRRLRHRAGRPGSDDLRRRARPSWSGPPGRTPATSPRRWRSAAPAGPRYAGCPSLPSAPTSPSSEMDWVVHIGLIELALGGLLGWAMVVRDEKPEWLRRIGIVAPQRIRQVHLDYVMMGLILIGVGLAVPDLPTAIAAALVFGTLVNPFLFVPLAFDSDTDKRIWYRAARRRLLHRRQRRPRRRGDRRPGLAARPSAVRRVRDSIARMPSVPKLNARGLAAVPCCSPFPPPPARLWSTSKTAEPGVYAANDNGGGAFRSGRASPGLARRRAIAYGTKAHGKRELRLARRGGGASRLLGCRTPSM